MRNGGTAAWQKGPFANQPPNGRADGKRAQRRHGRISGAFSADRIFTIPRVCVLILVSLTFAQLNARFSHETQEQLPPYASVTILFWSFAYVLTRLTLQVFFRAAAGVPSVFRRLPCALHRRVPKQTEARAIADLPLFFASGAVGFFLYMIAFNLGQATVTASTASVVIATVPVVTALLAGVPCLSWKANVRTFHPVSRKHSGLHPRGRSTRQRNASGRRNHCARHPPVQLRRQGGHLIPRLIGSVCGGLPYPDIAQCKAD